MAAVDVPAVTRYPLQPLLDTAGLNASHSVKALGLGGPEYRKYRDEGMTREVAERKALRVGLHPYEVWPEMVEHDLLEAQHAENARKERRRQYRRDYYLANRERELERQRERDRADAEVKRRYQRWYYQANRERLLEQQRRRDRVKAQQRRLLAALELEQIPTADRHLRAS